MVSLFPNSTVAFTGFIRAHEGRILDQDGAAIRLRGMGLAWDSGYCADSVAADVRRIAELGANTVRIVGDERGWDRAYLDTILDAAGRRSIGVVIGLDCSDSEPRSLTGTTCWENSDVQEQMVRAWVSLASNYRNRPEITAYELMAHPEFEEAGDYRFFAQYLIDSIREVDTQHLLIANIHPGDENPVVNDANLAYGFAEYHPDAFTLQGIGRRPTGVAWPGDYTAGVREVTEWSRRGTHGTHELKLLKLETIAPDGAQVVSPRVYVQKGARAHFGRVQLEEVSVFDRKTADTLVFTDTFSDRAVMWWQEPPEARMAWMRSDDVTGEGRLVLEGMGGRRVVAQPYTAFDIGLLPRAREQQRYRLKAWVAAENVDEAGIGIVFLKASRDRADSATIDARIKARAESARRMGAPIVLMEFGATRQAPSPDATDWIRAVIQACERHGISWHYRTYREFDDPERPGDRHRFGVYRAPPDVSTDQSVIWRDVYDILWNTYKRNPVAKNLTPAEPLVHRDNPVRPPSGCWFGAQASDSPADPVSPTTFPSIMAFSRRAGRSPAWISVHAPWKNDRGRWTKFPEETFREISASGAIPFLTWEPGGPGGLMPSGWILNGYADTYIRTIADESRRYRDTFVMRLHRGIDVGAYLHVFEIFESRRATNVSWMWEPVFSAAASDGSDSLVAEPAGAWPGAGSVDWIGLSVYDRPDLDDTGVPLRLFPAEEMREMLAQVARYEKPVCLAEAACEAVRGQGQWWVDALQRLREPEFSAIRSLVVVEGAPSMRVNAPNFQLRPESAHAIRPELANPYYVGSD